ncbi:hypothetical protein CWC22_000355 [Pseudoalteromonas rubra]|uniref:Uncharacterized protein n=1 Tax=Pseudoalteromonas rubra TaxID=43658 RepID=A0A7S7YQJ4_9GAMM|nr:hypothetical protein [Pseudoalteromonas rubra]QPB81552.1 hypothetical protein CWC22_000355 [Pseudoalteromonas rubra]
MLLTLICVFLYSSLGCEYGEVELEFGGKKYIIPKRYVKSVNTDFSNYSAEGIDMEGSIISLHFGSEEVVRYIKSYKPFTSKEGDFKSVFQVLVYKKENVRRFSSDYYAMLVMLEGEFKGARVQKDINSGYYLLTPNERNPSRRVYFKSDPESVDSIHDKISLIVAECQDILPRYNLSDCIMTHRSNGLFFQIEVSEINIALSNQLKQFVELKMEEWKR